MASPSIEDIQQMIRKLQADISRLHTTANDALSQSTLLQQQVDELSRLVLGPEGPPQCILKGSFKVKLLPFAVNSGHEKDSILVIGSKGGAAEYSLDGSHISDLPGTISGNIFSAVKTKIGGMFLTNANVHKAYFQTSQGTEWEELVPGTLETPRGLALTPQGTVCLVDEVTMCIYNFSPYGKLLQTTSLQKHKKLLSRPQYLTISLSGEIIISDYQKHCVHIFDTAGNLKNTIGSPGTAGMDDTMLDQPRAVLTDQANNVLIADYMNQRIQVFTPDGGFKGTLLSKEDGLDKPWALHFTDKNQLVVGEVDTKTIKVFDYKM